MRILGFCGTSESGKSTAANFLMGVIMQKLGIMEEWKINEKGKIEVLGKEETEEGEVDKWLEIDIENKDPGFLMWARGIHMNCKTYSLAYPLKKACRNLLGLTKEQTDTQEGKLTETKITWGQMSELLETKEKKRIKEEQLTDQFMTGRSVMEYFGSKVLRRLNPDIFVDALIGQLRNEEEAWKAQDITDNVVIITDVRRLNEAKRLKEIGATIVRLKRGNPPNVSESDIDEIEADFYVENTNMTIEEMCGEVIKIVNEIKLFEPRG